MADKLPTDRGIFPILIRRRDYGPNRLDMKRCHSHITSSGVWVIAGSSLKREPQSDNEIVIRIQCLNCQARLQQEPYKLHNLCRLSCWYKHLRPVLSWVLIARSESKEQSVTHIKNDGSGRIPRLRHTSSSSSGRPQYHAGSWRDDGVQCACILCPRDTTTLERWRIIH